MHTTKKTLGSIQLLRGIASMLVVLLTINYQENWSKEFLFNIFLFGGSGVDIFFVLSGFIITYTYWSYLEQPSTVIKFLKRRVIRIFPIYWIIITCFLLLQLALPTFYNTHFDTGLVNMLQTYLLLPGHMMLNGVSWSLTNELFFYGLFAIALIIPNKKLSLFILLAYFIFLILTAVIMPANANSNQYIQMLIFSMNIEFFLGVFIVLIVSNLSKKWIYPLLVSGILLFLAGAFLSNSGISVISSSSNSALNRVLYFGFPSFLIILTVVKLELSRTIKMHKIFLQLGDASYSIYLIHLPIVAAFYKVLSKFNITNGWILTTLSILIFFAVCKGGIIIYNKVEKPLIKKLNKLIL